MLVLVLVLHLLLLLPLPLPPLPARNLCAGRDDLVACCMSPVVPSSSRRLILILIQAILNKPQDYERFWSGSKDQLCPEEVRG